ncbi:MAG: WhiB family transcriptional regulator [Pseudonocardia sp.]|nr:WhiB family transcriptional regulator [Pseudonocardia sp.]
MKPVVAVAPWRWTATPACAGQPVNRFFADRGGPVEHSSLVDTANTLCRGCPARRECGRWAVATNASGLHAGCYRAIDSGPWESMLAGVVPLPASAAET